MAEIDVGKISEALNNKADLDLNNTQPFADYVVEWKVPTSSDPTWYRKYKSGWVEQGGKTAAFTNTGSGTGTGFNITLPIPMANTSYTATVCRAGGTDGGGSGWSFRELIVIVQNNSVITVSEWNNQAVTGTTAFAMWEVKGMSA